MAELDNIPLEKRKKICELYASGESFNTVARELKVGQGTVQRVLLDAGIPTRSRKEGFAIWRERNPSRGNHETEERRKSAKSVFRL